MARLGIDAGEKVHINLARYKSGSNVFEVVVEPDIAMNFKLGKAPDVSMALKYERIFSDAKKGLEAPEHIVQEVFGTTDPLQVAAAIIKKGDVQLSQAYREAEREAKRKRIIEIIHKNAVDPKTHLPHPAARIEHAIEEAKIRIDEHKSAEDQVGEIIKSLRPLLPIAIEVKEIQVKLPAQVASKSYGLLKNFGKLLKDEWRDDGSLVAVIEIPGGLEQDFYDKVNSATHGNNEIKVISIR